MILREKDPARAAAMPPHVAAAYAEYPAPARGRLMAVRSLIFHIAAATPGVGPLTETLKWGEPAYLTEASKSGSTVRLGWKPATPGHCALYFNCRTNLVGSFRTLFGAEFAFEGQRAIVLGVTDPLPRKPLGLCIAMALTCHRDRKGTSGRPRRDC